VAELKNHLEVIKILPKTNCRECGCKTCLTFALEVMKGGKRLEDCPHLEARVLAEHRVKIQGQPAIEIDRQKVFQELQTRVAAMDLSASAERLGATFRGDKLAVKCLGKDFLVDSQGNVTSECHIHHWVTLPLLNYVTSSPGKDIKGEWVPFRELKGGADWGRFFNQKCEKPFKKVIDGYTELFEYIIEVFDGRPAPELFESDIAVVIHPLPKLPVLICYWKSDGEMESDLNLFFDRTAEDNLSIEWIYSLGVGLVTMFEKIARTHGR